MDIHPWLISRELIPFIYLTIPLGIRFLVKTYWRFYLTFIFVLFVSHAPLTACDWDKTWFSLAKTQNYGFVGDLTDEEFHTITE